MTAEPGPSQAALARRVLVTPQSIGELPGSLACPGYVERTPGCLGRATTWTPPGICSGS